MPERGDRAERASLAALLFACALGSGQLRSPAGIAGAAAAISGAALLSVTLPPLISTILRRAGDVLLAGAFLLDAVCVMYPILEERSLLRVARPLAAGLAFIGLLALAGGRQWSPSRTLLPACLALLVVGGLLPSPPRAFHACVAAAALAVSCFLLAERSSFERRARARRLAPLALFVAVCAGLGMAMARVVPWLQPQVEAATAQLFDTRGAAGFTGLSLTSRLGDIEELALSRRVALRVSTDTPQRLRARVFTHFDGHAWSSQPAAGAADLVEVPPASLPEPLRRFFYEIPGGVLAAPAAAGRALGRGGLIRTRIVQVVDLGAVVAPVNPLLIGLPHAGRIDLHGVVTPSPSRHVELYAIVNPLDIGDRPQLPADASFEAELRLPPAADARVANLARELGGSAGLPEERVRRTLNHLDRNCSYSLAAPRPASRDVVAGFLFETRRGYCEYFATAATILLRLQGVPTRYVTGFKVRDEAYSAGHYVVRESDAHAWIESYIEGKGWTELDPTPSAQYERVHGSRRAGSLLDFVEGVRGAASELLARLRAGSLLAAASWLLQGASPLLFLLFLTGLAFASAPVGRWLRRRQGAGARSGGAAPGLDPQIAELLRRVDRMVREGGHPRPATRAPAEHLLAIPAAALDPRRRSEAARAIDCFYRARYGGWPPAQAEIDALLERLPAAE